MVIQRDVTATASDRTSSLLTSLDVLPRRRRRIADVYRTHWTGEQSGHVRAAPTASRRPRVRAPEAFGSHVAAPGGADGSVPGELTIRLRGTAWLFVDAVSTVRPGRLA